MNTADYQLRHGMFGRTGSVWSRQSDQLTRDRARNITEVAGGSSLIRSVDTLAHGANVGGRVLVDDVSFRFEDGNFAVTGRNPRDFAHVNHEGQIIAFKSNSPVLLADATPTPIATVDLGGVIDSAGELVIDEWYLIPIPEHMTPTIIESRGGDMLVAGVDFSAHRGFIATRTSPADIFSPGLVRVVAAYVTLPQPRSYTLGAPVGRRCSKFLTAYATQSQSLVAFRRAAAEYCGMFVFPEVDVVLGKFSTARAEIYITASGGALSIDYAHTPLPVGIPLPAGFIVASKFEILSESPTAPVGVLELVLNSGATVSLDGASPVKGLRLPQQAKVLIDYVEVDSITGKPHARIHLDGAPDALAALWERQRIHELATGEFLYTQFFNGGERSKMLPVSDLLADYYGPQLSIFAYSDLTPTMEGLLLQFVRDHKPTGCVVLTAAGGV